MAYWDSELTKYRREKGLLLSERSFSHFFVAYNYVFYSGTHFMCFACTAFICMMLLQIYQVCGVFNVFHPSRHTYCQVCASCRLPFFLWITYICDLNLLLLLFIASHTDCSCRVQLFIFDVNFLLIFIPVYMTRTSLMLIWVWCIQFRSYQGFKGVFTVYT